MKSDKKKKKKSNNPQLYKGILDITRSGMGFVTVKEGEQDILVRPVDFNTALHGDTVRVRIQSRSSGTGRMQGQIVEILERKQLDFLGHIELNPSFAFFIPDTG